MTVKERHNELRDMSEKTLMKELASGMHDAFGEVIDRYGPMVARTSYRILCDRADSEDITRKVFTRMWNMVPFFDESIPVSFRFYRITCRLCVRRLIKRNILEFFSVRQPVYEMSPPPSSGSEEDYIIEESWSIFCRASRNLSPKQRVVYVLMELEQMTAEEVAEVTGIYVEHVIDCLHQAKEKVRSELEIYGEVK